MFVHVEFQMRPSDYPLMMTLRADFEEEDLWNRLGLALREGAIGSYHPNYYIDKVRVHLTMHHPGVSWDIQCTDLEGQVWSLRYLRPGENPAVPKGTRTLNMRILKNHPPEVRRTRYQREPVI